MSFANWSALIISQVWFSVNNVFLGSIWIVIALVFLVFDTYND